MGKKHWGTFQPGFLRGQDILRSCLGTVGALEIQQRGPATHDMRTTYGYFGDAIDIAKPHYWETGMRTSKNSVLNDVLIKKIASDEFPMTRSMSHHYLTWWVT